MVKDGLVAIVVQLAILNQLSERLRESLKVYEQLLVLLEQVEILLSAHKLIQEERVGILGEFNIECLGLVSQLEVDL